MTDEKPLASGFGFDQVAVDAAKDLSGSWGRANAQKVFAILSSWRQIYRGPQRLIFNLTSTARRAFGSAKPVSLPKAGQSHTPFVD